VRAAQASYPRIVSREICALLGDEGERVVPARHREWLAGSEQPPWLVPSKRPGLAGRVAAPYRQWAKQSLLADRLPPVKRSGAVATSGASTSISKPLTIVNPPEGATYLVDPTLRREFQTLPLRVVASVAGEIEWSVDGRVLGRSLSDAPFHWPLAVGSHRVTARDSQGNTAEATVLVK
jgi:membrane carboxypeptidase/penicillin-binding protein PbpC